MQGGGVLGAMGRGLTGGNIMSPEYVSPDQGDMTRDEYDRAIVKSFNSIGNTGEEPVPQEVAAAMGRVRGLNPRAVALPANVGSIMPVSLPKAVVTAGKQFDENFPNEALGNMRINSITGNVEVLGPSGEVLSIIPASDYNMQNQ
tara:strand:- start:44 stop:478 length:435 start_codon:yes stop_codon:yes gene_type:complete